MFTRNRNAPFILFMLFGLVLVWQPVRAQALLVQPLSDSLDDAIKAALGPNYRPMDFPTTQQAKLLAADKGDGDVFGYSVALSGDGNTALVGAYSEDDGEIANNGAAYVFIRSGSVWTQQAKLLAADKAGDDYFGASVSLSSDGNTALVGANGKDDNGIDSGAAYVFTRSGNIWTQQSKLLAADKAGDDYFGASVSLSSDGNTALIGASGEDDSGTANNGAVYIFTRNSGVWTQQDKLLAADKATEDFFGTSVSLSNDGNTILVGAFTKDDSGTANNGSAYIFTRVGSAWTQQAKILVADKADSDYFGWSVSLNGDGNTALIGANGKDANGIDSGTAYVFTRSGNIWTQQAKLLATDNATGDYFGYSVSLSSDGNTALIGANTESDSGTLYNGAVYIFTRISGIWMEQTKLLTADKAPGDKFGQAVSLNDDGSTALIGTPFKSDSGMIYNGAAYIFTDALPPTATSTPTNTPVPSRPDTIGVYKDGAFYLRNENSTGSEDILSYFGGDPGDLPTAGDWNGDGVDTIGVYRSSTGFFFLSDSSTSPTVSYTVLFGNPGDTPFAGRWTADMTHDGIGVYRNSSGILYQKKDLTTGFDDFFGIYGDPGDQGIAGDWDGNGFDSIGIYRPATTHWFLSNNSTPGGITFSDIDFDWSIGDNPAVIGDWDGDLDSTPGYLTATGNFVLHPNNAAVGTDNVFPFGPIDGKPISGKWIAPSRPPVSAVINTGRGGGNTGDTDSVGGD